MTDLFLALIALATLAMAAIQIGAIVYASRLARRIEGMLGRVEREIQPLLARLRDIGDDAAKASGLAVAQLERVDNLLADAAARIDTTLQIVQQAIVAPAREGVALVSAFRAVMNAFRGRGGRRKGADAESEDALFIG